MGRERHSNNDDQNDQQTDSRYSNRAPVAATASGSSRYSNNGNQGAAPARNFNKSTPSKGGSGGSSNFSKGDADWGSLGAILTSSKSGKPYFKANDFNKYTPKGRRLELIAIDLDTNEQFVINMATLSEALPQAAEKGVLFNVSVNLKGDGVKAIVPF